MISPEQGAQQECSKSFFRPSGGVNDSLRTEVSMAQIMTARQWIVKLRHDGKAAQSAAALTVS